MMIHINKRKINFTKGFVISYAVLYICSPQDKKVMKKDIHPSNYRLVVFKDMSSDYEFLTKSCVNTKETIKYKDGNEYPVFKIEISDKSHPFFTGKQTFIDSTGRIDKFKRRYSK